MRNNRNQQPAPNRGSTQLFVQFHTFLLMKVNILIGIVLLAVVYMTCKNFKKTEATEAPVAAVATPAPSNGKVLKIMGEGADSTNRIQFSEPPPHVDVPWDKMPRPSTSRRAFMSSGYWNPVTAIQPTDTTIYKQFRPKWLKFKDDQTFDIIIKNKVMETGHWAFDEENFVLYLSCTDPYFNNSWNIKERGFRMILIGNTAINLTGIQVRLDMQNQLPAN